MSGAVFAGRFAGNVLVVTGAAQGIGRAVALRAAAEGGRVLLVDRADFVAEIAARHGRPVATPAQAREILGLGQVHREQLLVVGAHG